MPIGWDDMSVQTDGHTSRFRKLVRASVGRPGSLRRWAIGTLVWLFGCFVVSFYVPWGARIVIFLFAGFFTIASFRARSLLIGDEDELRAAVRHERKRAPVAEDEVEPELEPWLPSGAGSFADAPPPPIMDDGEQGVLEGESRDPAQRS